MKFWSSLLHPDDLQMVPQSAQSKAVKLEKLLCDVRILLNVYTALMGGGGLRPYEKLMGFELLGFWL